MSTKSTSGFEWSVKLIIGDIPYFDVGIASIFKLGEGAIRNYDETAILCSSDYSLDANVPIIRIGKNIVDSSLTRFKTGDVIRFRFQPLIKKLIIELVRF